MVCDMQHFLACDGPVEQAHDSSVADLSVGLQDLPHASWLYSSLHSAPVKAQQVLDMLLRVFSISIGLTRELMF